MVQMIDSSKQQLNSADIVTIALENNQVSVDGKNKYSPEVAYAAILSEMSQPNTEVKQIGNTLFVVHPDKDGRAFFKALNADSAQKFLSNSKAFCIWAKNELQLELLVTEFEDHAIEVLFKAIARNPPFPGMGYQVFHMRSGKTRILLNLGN